MLDVKAKERLSSPVFSISNKITRVVWGIIYILFFKYSPVPFFSYRRLLINIFGGSIAKNVNIYPTTKIWLPSNLIMEQGSTLGPNVNVYNQGLISIGENSIISQGVHICSSTHDYEDSLHPLILAPIEIGHNVWVCADAFIGPNVIIKDGAVIGARAVLVKSTEYWSVYAGNPAIKIKDRKRF
ncbi:putative colanic acid biosynthesis acetyltransferase [Psychromonas sp. PT13]|uniref:putative colanic acid biosynthesis acetyltransferase n=1 Tax=Psychromonas sp. PT13 TaxID=3439547 RepID=UPI003EB8EC50